ncbi:inositol hexakisphosphate and diphosphoinositol-pentakisphosphate kinase 2 [Elysia marginata]|uniref:Inositol hexakisphosphate and diphosphoinositol-pentakisphosphate kinase 2 n=1 Tax=Elysia marginata TaxID=1093978 RepID=A0AAV4GHL1_9GAST|nr:inositol hexakisphosphate and diphosphoinositol-pentakisphosphate kinase 2 [Elysia marginata]
MGSFDGAETCELVGLYLLTQLQSLDVNVGLYRDDGLAVSDKSPKQNEDMKKKICKIFKNTGLSITIDANKKVVDFLDVSFNLQNECYRPFMKPNQTTNYVHKNSNHPPTIIKNIPSNIAKRLSTISKNKKIFEATTTPYNEALRKSGYHQTLNYTEEQIAHQKKRNRSRNVLWFNPPFHKCVQTNIGKKLLSLVDVHFPKSNKLSKTIYRNYVKVSYSCLPNIKQIITTHNKKVLQASQNNEESKNNPGKQCNCRKKQDCPVEGECLKENVIYQAIVEEKETKTTETYIGLTQNTFKTRYNLHLSTFRLSHKRKSTSLSDYIWKIKDRNNSFKITWKILTQTKRVQAGNDRCDLCTTEKLFIFTNKHASSLNIKTEILNKCPHKRIFYAPCGGNSTEEVTQRNQFPEESRRRNNVVGTQEHAATRIRISKNILAQTNVNMWTFLLTLLACLSVAEGDNCEATKANEIYYRMGEDSRTITPPAVLDSVCQNKTLLDNCDLSVITCRPDIRKAVCPYFIDATLSILDYQCSDEGKAANERLADSQCYKNSTIYVEVENLGEICAIHTCGSKNCYTCRLILRILTTTEQVSRKTLHTHQLLVASPSSTPTC